MIRARLQIQHYHSHSHVAWEYIEARWERSRLAFFMAKEQTYQLESPALQAQVNI